MRIVIDLQGAQTDSRFCGVGRYTMSLALAIVRNRGEHEIIFALSGLFADTIEPIRAAFDGLLPQENIRVWHAPSPLRECDPRNELRREVAKRIREAFLANLDSDVIFIPSLFEGYQDDAIVSIGVFAPNLKTVIAVDRLDVVPTVNNDPGQRSHVLRLLEYLKRADLLLVLPPLTVDEVSVFLGGSQELIKAGFAIGDVEANVCDATAEACNLLKIFEKITTASTHAVPLPLSQRRKLAYVSPLPPERSGIAGYSAELLPELSRHYDIDVIVAQDSVSDPWVNANCALRSVAWFRANAARYDRVIYHFGNSHFHQHMFSLLVDIPGVVVLHDFFLSHIAAHMDVTGYQPDFWVQTLYQSHGYAAVQQRFHTSDTAEVLWRYPCNLGVLRGALGVVVHSENSRRLASEWYGEDAEDDWAVVPLLRVAPEPGIDRAEARRQLRLGNDDFVVCSFGLLGPSKLNHRLLNAWLKSTLAKDANCVLVFVGENHNGDYGAELVTAIGRSGLDKRIRITGWADTGTFRSYLAAADVGVQLRTLSRGETSAAVLDCMNYALPTIVNANGSMADLPTEAVCTLPDIFEDCQLVEALETLWQDGERRAALGQRAQEAILTRHSPHTCAEQYAEAIERFHARSKSGSHGLVRAIANLEGYFPADSELKNLAQTIAQSLPVRQPVRQLLLDISATSRTDLKTGIERVARALILAMLESPPAGYRIEPVYLSKEGDFWHYKYARRYTLDLLDCPIDRLVDEVVEPRNGDFLLGLDLSGQMLVDAEAAGLFANYRNAGVAVHFIVYDLLPVQLPQFFPPGADDTHCRWLQTIAKFDGALCISQSVADDLNSWVKSNSHPRRRGFKIDWFHLGADVGNSAPTRGLPKDAEKTLELLSTRPNFLMVATIEPRKGYLQTLDAFSQLWQQGLDINLVIVGNGGWKGLPDHMRRTIPEIVNRLRNHPELGKRLFWLEGISDEYLEKVYAASSCLIVASSGEGFGLPLIEAAQHKLPIIARDIPIFREVAGEHVFYFSGLLTENLAHAILTWLELNQKKIHPKSECMHYLTWHKSAANLLNSILNA
jgi:glycosyltransferase involved in cell wall biosynthesis